ncbi:MAG: PAS domain S-box protein, partial [Flavitalea sp.]
EIVINPVPVAQGFYSITVNMPVQRDTFITEKKLLSAVLRLPGKLICASTADGIYKMVNSSFAECLKYQPEEMVGKHFIEFVYGPDKEKTVEYHTNHLLKMYTCNGFENRYLAKNGEIKWFSWSATYIEEDKLIIASPADITFKKRVEEKLTSKTEELNNVVSSLDDVVFEYDQDGNFKKLWCNNESILQLMPPDYVGKSMHEAYQSLPELTGNFIHDFESAIANNEIFYRDFSLSFGNEIYWLNSKITPMFHADGSARGFSQRITDISEKKKVEIAISEKNFELKSAHRELREIIENTSEIIFKLDLDDTIIFVSPEFERSIGFPGSEVVGTHISKIVHPDDRERFENELMLARSTGKSTTHNIFRAMNRNGSDRWFNTSAKFVRDTNGESFIGIVFAQDITDLKVTMDSLSASEERYRSVVNALGEGVIMHDDQGGVIACNKAAEFIFDLDENESITDNLRRVNVDVIHENGERFRMDDFPATITLATGMPVKDVVMGIRKRNGERTWLSLNTEPVYYTSDDGPPDAVVTSLYDITSKKLAEENLEQNRQKVLEYSKRITAILDSITDAFIAVDNNFRITLWNKVIENITGISGTYAVGRKLGELQSYLLNLLVYDNCQKSMQQQNTANFEVFVSELAKWFEINMYPTGEGLFINFRDITMRKQQETLLALEKGVLEYNATPVASLKSTVDYFIEGLEHIFPGMYCSVLTLDEDGRTMRHLSAPSLPKEYTDQINGLPIGPSIGTCGTAMYTKTRVIVTDIRTDYLWANYRDLAAKFNLVSCWSFPIKNAENEVLATIAAYFPQPKVPSDYQLAMFDRVQNLLKVIIENKRADSRIRMSNERYLLATRATNDAIWDYDLFSNTIVHGDAYASIFGYKSGKKNDPDGNWVPKIHPDDRERTVKSFDEFVKGNTNNNWEAEYRYQRADGEYVIVNDRGFLIYNQQGKIARVVGSMQDVTEKKQLERQILKTELDKQKLVAQAVVDAQEKERAEIGKELHDNVNQILSTAKLYLELARSDENERLKLISRSGDNIVNAINEIRAISRSLVPPSIGDLGIIVSIQDLIENVRATKKLHIEFYYTEGIETMINEKLQLMLFRIIQEQTNNTLKHAEATNLIIELMIDNSIVDLTISDNGKGFDKNTMKNKRGGVGLTNIASRTELFNGEVNIITSPGKGCTLNIHIPITNV